MTDFSSPIELHITAADPDRGKLTLNQFSSYQFDRNMLVPASPFRFTAEGVDIATRRRIKSADLVELFMRNEQGDLLQIATGFIDDREVSGSSTSIEFILSGRDTLSRLVDNAAVDSQNRIVHFDQISLQGIAEFLVQNTSIPGGRNINNPKVIVRNAPTGPLLFQTNPQETKISALQRYLEFCNCLVWTERDGQVVIGKPTFTQALSGTLQSSSTSQVGNNLMSWKVKRAENRAIRQIAMLLQTLSITDPSSMTLKNSDPDVVLASKTYGGKSILRTYSLGNGMDAVNQIQKVGNNREPQQIGYSLARREIAMSNLEVLGVQCTVDGHMNKSNFPIMVDQVYNIFIEDDDVHEDMYLYHAQYNMTKDRGRTTVMEFCKIGALVADVPNFSLNSNTNSTTVVA